ncbi:ABC transporter permease [Clostridium intestinale]|uniref:Putative ABC transport system permease protein n=1 Tax=Clostridium intestinale DSM 6191 TaxID=1121320 RepID=A0A1M5WKZ2_9CLOT|nr:FtsX-like permease family protein [Clostridium intestinale]SHH88195.1 putative ABC transport system permease protein [Clostridium intestinale DSM 6191]
MYGKIIKNDIRKSKLITVTITAFILVASMLTALAASMTVNLFGAIDNMLVSAKSLHFMQMHTGDVDRGQLQSFAEDNDKVEDYQVLEFLNIEGADIVIGDDSLAGSIQDNGLSVQGKKFDFLLNLDGEVIHPNDGEIYVPIYYMKEGNVALGDKVKIHDISFTVAGFLRDSVMNATLVSSKRFLVSQADFERVREFGKLEYLIEFRLAEDVSFPAFEADYINAGLPANGPPAITYKQVKMINGITDGIMIAVLMLISLLVIIVTFLCIRFTLLAKIEEDYKEIGVLKAIGIRVSLIKKLYLAKYGAIAGVACALGFLVSLPLQTHFMKNISLYMGESRSEIPGLLWGVLGAMLIFGVVMLYVNSVLKRFRKISAAQAVRFGAPREKSKFSRTFRLSDNRVFSRNIFLGIKDILSRKKLYITMLMVLIISSFIMIVPQNISSTISAKSFITYMGMGICDANIGVMRTQVEDVVGKANEIVDVLVEDKNVENYTLFTSRMLDRITDEGRTEKLMVAFGDYSVFPITYSKGYAPQLKSEIALSNLNAKDLEKTVGDEIVLMVDGSEKHLKVCGVYSDVTNGGRTAQAIFDTNSGDVLSVGIAVTFLDRKSVNEAIEQYREQFPFAKITGIDESIKQMLGSIRDAVKMASTAAIGTTILITLLVTMLFIRMIVTKDRHPIAILKSIGFTSKDIRGQYLTRSITVLILGLIIGTILANTLGELVGVAIVSSFGATTFRFVVNPWFVYLISPLLIACCIITATRPGISGIQTLKVSDYIKED